MKREHLRFIVAYCVGRFLAEEPDMHGPAWEDWCDEQISHALMYLDCPGDFEQDAREDLRKLFGGD